MTAVTQILTAIEGGDRDAAERLLPLVYDELRALAARRLAQERSGQTLDATALVHEAYLRLVGSDGASAREPRWQGRPHFYAAAGEAMRRILIDRARDKARLKRGGGRRRVDLDGIDPAKEDHAEEAVALDEVIGRLAQEDRACADLVKLRVFAGMSLREAGESLGMAPRTADRSWAFARVWLYEALGQGSSR